MKLNLCVTNSSQSNIGQWLSLAMTTSRFDVPEPNSTSVVSPASLKRTCWFGKCLPRPREPCHQSILARAAHFCISLSVPIL